MFDTELMSLVKHKSCFTFIWTNEQYKGTHYEHLIPLF